MFIHKANNSVNHPRGVIRDMLFNIEIFIFHIDFFILEMEEDIEVPIIWGRPFPNTARAMDASESKLTLRVGSKALTFGL